ncbi:MAG: cysteine desulfurase [Candidatus Pacebacteria bacterium CG10_big_fil_rev_8_21_14_0_10_44_11]|nr:MAG: cysteine desulfurase [Candidatus Pacebacteria bacterium CG10_big_fil_rev_8_21_14_0_10_44_11]
MFNPEELKQDFPILSRQINGQSLVYLDNAATSQKPQVVIDAISHYYQTSNANVHRGVHALSDESTKLWETSRATIATFFGANPGELILTRNTTEAINGVAYGWADHHLSASDVILTTPMEHHSDLVVWQQVCQRTGAELRFLEVDETGRLKIEQLEEIFAHSDIKLISLGLVSNTLGTRNPVEKIVKIARKLRPEVKILLDGAQAAPHLPLDFHELDCDFFAFSGHKMLGPMGIGGLLVKQDLLESKAFQPWLFGGGMIATVEREKTEFAEDLADRFTAGTPDVASTVGLAAACRYLQQLGMKEVAQHDQELVQYALEKLTQISEVTLIGPVYALPAQPLDRVGSVAFIYQGVHAHDVAQILDSQGVAVRSGHHCTMPLHTQFNWQATVRASFQVYNSQADIDKLVAALAKVKAVFGI